MAIQKSRSSLRKNFKHKENSFHCLTLKTLEEAPSFRKRCFEKPIEITSKVFQIVNGFLIHWNRISMYKN